MRSRQSRVSCSEVNAGIDKPRTVLTVEPWGLDGANEELRAVCVRSSVCHRQHTLASVLQLEVLILELLAVDGFAASAVAVGEVTTLQQNKG